MIDIVCIDCGNIFQSNQRDDNKNYIILSCIHCNSKNTYRKYSTINMNIKKGKVGNASNGYTTVQ